MSWLHSWLGTISWTEQSERRAESHEQHEQDRYAATRQLCSKNVGEEMHLRNLPLSTDIVRVMDLPDLLGSFRIDEPHRFRLPQCES